MFKVNNKLSRTTSMTTPRCSKYFQLKIKILERSIILATTSFLLTLNEEVYYTALLFLLSTVSKVLFAGLI